MTEYKDNTHQSLEDYVASIISPILASAKRKRRMREELLAHLRALYDEELARTGDAQQAEQEAIERFGGRARIRKELQRSVPLVETAVVAVAALALLFWRYSGNKSTLDMWLFGSLRGFLLLLATLYILSFSSALAPGTLRMVMDVSEIIVVNLCILVFIIIAFLLPLKIVRSYILGQGPALDWRMTLYWTFFVLSLPVMLAIVESLSIYKWFTMSGTLTYLTSLACLICCTGLLLVQLLIDRRSIFVVAISSVAFVFVCFVLFLYFYQSTILHSSALILVFLFAMLLSYAVHRVKGVQWQWSPKAGIRNLRFKILVAQEQTERCKKTNRRLKVIADYIFMLGILGIVLYLQWLSQIIDDFNILKYLAFGVWFTCFSILGRKLNLQGKTDGSARTTY